ncbi:hypothetical protein BVI2075_200020 [Burkholderia vietnamiensis]|nr:hypothetical protein BVI2075_200020 [Burkholderia vietnamiensis]
MAREHPAADRLHGRAPLRLAERAAREPRQVGRAAADDDPLRGARLCAGREAARVDEDAARAAPRRRSERDGARVGAFQSRYAQAARRVLPGRRIRPGQALAARAFRDAGDDRPPVVPVYADRRARLAEGRRGRAGDRRPRAERAQPVRADVAVRGMRADRARERRRHQRFRADARGRGAAPAARRAVRVDGSAPHPSAVGAGEGTMAASRMQSLLRTRMPARPSELPARARPGAGIRRLARHARRAALTLAGGVARRAGQSDSPVYGGLIRAAVLNTARDARERQPRCHVLPAFSKPPPIR